MSEMFKFPLSSAAFHLFTIYIILCSHAAHAQNGQISSAIPACQLNFAGFPLDLSPLYNISVASSSGNATNFFFGFCTSFPVSALPSSCSNVYSTSYNSYAVSATPPHTCNPVALANPLNIFGQQAFSIYGGLILNFGPLVPTSGINSIQAALNFAPPNTTATITPPSTFSFGSGLQYLLTVTLPSVVYNPNNVSEAFVLQPLQSLASLPPSPAANFIVFSFNVSSLTAGQSYGALSATTGWISITQNSGSTVSFYSKASPSLLPILTPYGSNLAYDVSSIFSSSGTVTPLPPLEFLNPQQGSFATLFIPSTSGFSVSFILKNSSTNASSVTLPPLVPFYYQLSVLFLQNISSFPSPPTSSSPYIDITLLINTGGSIPSSSATFYIQLDSCHSIYQPPPFILTSGSISNTSLPIASMLGFSQGLIISTPSTATASLNISASAIPSPPYYPSDRTVAATFPFWLIYYPTLFDAILVPNPVISFLVQNNFVYLQWTPATAPNAAIQNRLVYQIYAAEIQSYDDINALNLYTACALESLVLTTNLSWPFQAQGPTIAEYYASVAPYSSPAGPWVNPIGNTMVINGLYGINIVVRDPITGLRGVYQPFALNPNPGNCPAGSYNISTSAAVYNCSLCPPGQFTATPTTANYCNICQTGTANPYWGGNSSDACVSCLPGTFNNLPGQAQCSLCPPSKYQDQAGALFCRSCTSTSSGGSSSSYYCPSGTSIPLSTQYQAVAPLSPISILSLIPQSQESALSSTDTVVKKIFIVGIIILVSSFIFSSLASLSKPFPHVARVLSRIDIFSRNHRVAPGSALIPMGTPLGGAWTVTCAVSALIVAILITQITVESNQSIQYSVLPGAGSTPGPFSITIDLIGLSAAAANPLPSAVCSPTYLQASSSGFSKQLITTFTSPPASSAVSCSITFQCADCTILPPSADITVIAKQPGAVVAAFSYTISVPGIQSRTISASASQLSNTVFPTVPNNVFQGQVSTAALITWGEISSSSSSSDSGYAIQNAPSDAPPIPAGVNGTTWDPTAILDLNLQIGSNTEIQFRVVVQDLLSGFSIAAQVFALEVALFSAFRFFLPIIERLLFGRNWKRYRFLQAAPGFSYSNSGALQEEDHHQSELATFSVVAAASSSSSFAHRPDTPSDMRDAPSDMHVPLLQ